MMDTNLYWNLRGTYAERQAKLAAVKREFLEAAILDSEYNDFLGARSDYREDEKQTRPGGKRLPYIGWFWRHLEFSSGRLPVGDCGEFIGFIANNKWDYAERSTTPEEFAAIMAIIDEAMRLNQEGGELTKIDMRVRAKLDELWDLLASFDVNAIAMETRRAIDSEAGVVAKP